jgi:hypothetical protein
MNQCTEDVKLSSNTDGNEHPGLSSASASNSSPGIHWDRLFRGLIESPRRSVSINFDARRHLPLPISIIFGRHTKVGQRIELVTGGGGGILISPNFPHPLDRKGTAL